MTGITLEVLNAAKPEDFVSTGIYTPVCNYCAQSDSHHYACPIATEERRRKREQRRCKKSTHSIEFVEG